MACSIRGMRWLAVMLVPLWLGTFAPAAAGSAPPEPVRLAAGMAQASLSGHLGRLIDPGHALTLDGARQADAAGSFEPLPTFVGAGHTADVHWYRFLLQREPGAPADWVVELGEAFIDHIDLFVVGAAGSGTGTAQEGSLSRFALGDHVPFSERPMRTRLHSVMLSLPEGRPVTVYLRVDTISAMMLSARIWTPAAFIGHETSTLLLHGLFFGVLAVLVLLYLALAMALEDGTLVAYTGFVTTLFFYYLGANGIAAVWLPDLPGWVLNLLTGGSGLLGVSAAIVMWDRILNLRQTFPRVHRVYMVLAALGLLTVPTAVSPLYAVTNRPMILLALVISLVSLLLILHLMIRDREDVGIRYYFVGLVVALAGLVVTQLALRGVLPAEGFYASAYQIGSASHVVILAAGLSHRVRRLQADRIRARQETDFAMKRADQQRTFVAMLSHEFRTPLASIDSAAQMIAETAEALPASAASRLERIRATARRLGNLVDLFLSSEALDQGALALHPERVALRELLDSALETAAPEAGERVRLPDDSQDRILRADPHLLAVAIGNLVQNALRYSPAGAPVEVATDWEPGGVAISVRDHGRGMSADEVERIGSMYFRASSSRGTKGAGIGLFIARQIVAAHGGTLQVQSRIGEGSVFTIRLPQRPPA